MSPPGDWSQHVCCVLVKTSATKYHLALLVCMNHNGHFITEAFLVTM